MKKLALILLAGVLISAPSGFALYSDEIAVSLDEVWPATKEALRPFRLKKIDENKKTFETNWTYDTVKESSGLLKNYIHDEFDRRYRYKVSMTDRYGDTHVVIKAVFQKRRRGLEQYSWRLVKGRADDLDVERDAFMKILKQMQKQRSEAPPA